VQVKELDRSAVPYALPSRCADNEELAHDSLVLAQATYERYASERWAAVNQVTASVGIFKESR
jgi:hypothetical protein